MLNGGKRADFRRNPPVLRELLTRETAIKAASWLRVALLRRRLSGSDCPGLYRDGYFGFTVSSPSFRRDLWLPTAGILGYSQSHPDNRLTVFIISAKRGRVNNAPFLSPFFLSS